MAFKGDTCGAFSRMRVCVLSLMLSYHILVSAPGGAGDLLVGRAGRKLCVLAHLCDNLHFF